MPTALLFDLSLAWRNILRHGRRSLIAVGAVAFGVASLLLAAGFIEWMFYGMREWTIRSQLGHIQVMRPGYLSEGLADPFSYLLPDASPELRSIGETPEVRVVAPRLAFSGLISRGDATLSFIAQGVDPDSERLVSSTLQITKGHNLDAGDERGIIVGQGLAANLGVGVGDSVILMANTPAGGVNAVECRIRGLFATVSKAYDDTALRMPLPAARSLLRVSDSHVWVLLLDATESTPRVLASLTSRFAGSGLEFVAWDQMADMYRKTVALFSRQVDVMKAIVAAIIVLSISNVMIMSVSERTGEIGTLLALGVRRRQVIRGFLLEGLVLGALGGAIGLAIGTALALAISAVGIPMPPPPGMARGYTAEIAVSAPLAAEALGMALATTFAATVYPAWKGSRAVIVDALRHNR